MDHSVGDHMFLNIYIPPETQVMVSRWMC